MPRTDPCLYVRQQGPVKSQALARGLLAVAARPCGAVLRSRNLLIFGCDPSRRLKAVSASKYEHLRKSASVFITSRSYSESGP
jgi:hypothetical protein